jgi:phage terminase small subunit
MVPGMALTNKQAAFVREYLVDLNGTQAAIRAGYSPKSADRIAFELLKETPEVAAEVQLQMDKRAQATGITAQSVLDRLNKVADRCMQAEEVRDKEGNPTGEYKFDSGGACRALELIGKHLKLFTDKIEVEASDALAERIAKAQARLSQRVEGE